MIVHPIETIVSDPEIRNGQAHIAGSGVRVLDIVASHLYRGLPPEELATNFNLNLGQVYAALAYYYQHKSVLDAQLRDEADAAQRLLAQLEEQGKLLRHE
ncbi:MAG: DUF433 domain-containing protein, partial [Anaerolineae bacterium]|nr:DUF433 domain-containing protein [Anaerolineae bacterium]